MDNLHDIIDRYKSSGKEALLSVLQEIQEEEGYLSMEVIHEVSHSLNVPENQIYSIATFYDQFKFVPQARRRIRICEGTACHILGSSIVVREIKKLLGIEPGQMSKDNEYGLELVECMGACSQAPAMQINERYYNRVTPEKLRQILEHLSKIEE